MAYSNRRESGVQAFWRRQNLEAGRIHFWSVGKMKRAPARRSRVGMYAAVLRDRIIELRGEK